MGKDAFLKIMEQRMVATFSKTKSASTAPLKDNHKEEK
jgi:hypothetical protein